MDAELMGIAREFEIDASTSDQAGGPARSCVTLSRGNPDLRFVNKNGPILGDTDP